MTGPTRFLVPLGLAAAAAVANFVLISRQTAKVEVVVLVADVPAGTALTRDHLGKMVLRADAKLFPNALRTDEVGLVEGMVARRSLKKGEILFRADVEDDAQLPLVAPEHHTWTVTVKPEQITAFVTPGQRVVLKAPALPAPGDTNSARRDPNNPEVVILGPYRLVGANTVGSVKDPRRQLVLAVPENDEGEALYAGLVDTPRTDKLRVEKVIPTARKSAPIDSQLSRDR